MKSQVSLACQLWCPALAQTRDRSQRRAPRAACESAWGLRRPSRQSGALLWEAEVARPSNDSRSPGLPPVQPVLAFPQASPRCPSEPGCSQGRVFSVFQSSGVVSPYPTLPPPGFSYFCFFSSLWAVVSWTALPPGFAWLVHVVSQTLRPQPVTVTHCR